MPFLSVIIPHYNNAELLARCIKSLTAARLGDELQIVVVDDSSSPEERQRIEALIEQLTSQDEKNSLELVCNSTNQGVSAARNRGLLMAKGQFVWFVDADDEVDTEALNLWWHKLRELGDSVDLLHIGPMITGDAKGGTELNQSQFDIRSISMDNLLIPRSHCLDHTTYWISLNLLKRFPEIRYMEDVAILEDSIFILQLLDVTKRVVAASDCCLYIRHNDARSVTSGAWSKEKSAKFLPCIALFFRQLSGFMDRYKECPYVADLYHRYCYVYMRVLAVKGVPIMLYRNMFYNPVIRFGFVPQNLKERLLKNTLIHAILSSLCRIVRHSHD